MDKRNKLEQAWFTAQTNFYARFAAQYCFNALLSARFAGLQGGKGLLYLSPVGDVIMLRLCKSHIAFQLRFFYIESFILKSKKPCGLIPFWKPLAIRLW